MTRILKSRSSICASPKNKRKFPSSSPSGRRMCPSRGSTRSPASSNPSSAVIKQTPLYLRRRTAHLSAATPSNATTVGLRAHSCSQRRDQNSNHGVSHGHRRGGRVRGLIRRRYPSDRRCVGQGQGGLCGEWGRPHGRGSLCQTIGRNEAGAGLRREKRPAGAEGGTVLQSGGQAPDQQETELHAIW